MGSNPALGVVLYAYKDSLEVKKVEDNTVVFEVEGLATGQDEEYSSDTNTTMEMELSREKAEEMAKEILDS